jgi:hypothetical protein
MARRATEAVRAGRLLRARAAGAEKDPARRAALLATPTTLFLRKDDVRALRESGAQQVRESPDLRKLVQALR